MMTQKYLLILLTGMVIAGCTTTQRYEVLDSDQRERLIAENDNVFEGEVVRNPTRGKRYFFGLFPVLARIDDPGLVDPGFLVKESLKGINPSGIQFRKLQFEALSMGGTQPMSESEEASRFYMGSEYLVGHQGESFGKYKHLQFILLKAWDEE